MIKWNEVAWYSRLSAIVLFIGIVPVLAFYIGVQYSLLHQEVNTLDNSKSHETAPTITPQVTAHSFVDQKIEGDLAKCLDTPDYNTQVGMTCENTALDGYTTLEHKRYALLISKITSEANSDEMQSEPGYMKNYYTDAAGNLAAAEKAWGVYMDRMCTANANLWTTGTGADGADLSCRAELTQKHIQDLLDADLML